RGALDRGRDLAEATRDLLTENRQGRDDDHRDEGGDEAVLDGRRARFVLNEVLHEVHLLAPAFWLLSIVGSALTERPGRLCHQLFWTARETFSPVKFFSLRSVEAR